jgi:hypothetical protein
MIAASCHGLHGAAGGRNQPVNWLIVGRRTAEECAKNNTKFERNDTD